MTQTGPNPQISYQLALEYILLYFCNWWKKCQVHFHSFQRNNEATLHGVYPILIFPLHYGYSQAEQSRNLRKATRRKTASKFSALLSKVWAEFLCTVSGEETIEKGLLKQWTVAFSNNSFFEFLLYVIEELWKSKLVIMLKIVLQRSENSKNSCKEWPEGKPPGRPVGQLRTAFTHSLQKSQSRWVDRQWDTGCGWRKGQSEQINEWVDGVEGWCRCVWSWVRKCGWTKGKVSSPQSQGYPQSAEYFCILKKVGHRMTYQDLGFPGCKVFLLWLKIFRPLREINSDPLLGF